MNIKTWFLSHGLGCAVLAMLLSATPSHGAVVATPSILTFTSSQQSFDISLSSGGVPVLAKDIRSWQLMASGHDYKHMINVEKSDGSLKISPSTTVEVGSYDLVVDTAQGVTSVKLFTPLSDVDDIVQKIASITELSEKQVAEKMGLLSTSGRVDIEIALPPVYYEGQTLELNMAELPGVGHRATWFMNGVVIAEGLEHSTLRYTFREPGEYVLSYVETEQKDGAISPVARARAYTRVVPVPAMATASGVNVVTKYTAPAGYRSFVWHVDGKEVSSAAFIEQTFVVPGVYEIQCLASSPENGPAESSLRVRYITTVN